MIELVRVSRRFGDLVAVDDVSLVVRGGEFLTLLGPSGCGKSTLLRIISGFEHPDGGAVLLDGRDVTGLPPYRRDVNQVFQNYALFPHMSVWDNVAFGLRMRRVGRKELARRVSEAMALVALAGTERRRPDQLSGGQRQRVALARAIVLRPKVLLLDEPLAALDAKLRQAVQIELKQLQQRVGITFVFVTHDQSEALVMSDRVAVMNAGKIEQVAPPAEIYGRPSTTFVAGFVGRANLWDAVLIDRADGFAVLRVGADVTLRVPADAVPAGAAAVRVLIRPEKVSLRADGAGFGAEVREVFFTGATSHVHLRTPSGLTVQALTAHVPGDAEIAPVVGQRVLCDVRPQDVAVLA